MNEIKVTTKQNKRKKDVYVRSVIYAFVATAMDDDDADNDI